MDKLNEKGLIPLVAVFLIGIIVSASVVVVKNTPINEPQPNPELGFQGSVSALLKPKSTTTPSQAPSTKPKAKAISSPSPAATSTSSSGPSTSSAPSNTSSPTSTSSAPTPTPIPSPSPTPTPTPTPPPLKTYTYSNSGINVTTKCYTGDSTFDIEVNGSAIPTNSGEGIWATLSGNGQTVYVSYSSGSASSPSTVAFNFNDSVNNIRGFPSSIALQTSGSVTYWYEIKAYSAPYTDGTPSLSNQVGNVSFATDCK